jgi:hypothetical protein
VDVLLLIALRLLWRLLALLGSLIGILDRRSLRGCPWWRRGVDGGVNIQIRREDAVGCVGVGITVRWCAMSDGVDKVWCIGGKRLSLRYIFDPVGGLASYAVVLEQQRCLLLLTHFTSSPPRPSTILLRR